jgi:hypothetical protein
MALVADASRSGPLSEKDGFTWAGQSLPERTQRITMARFAFPRSFPR